MYKIFKVTKLSMILLLLCACRSSLSNDLEMYESSMDKIYELDKEYYEHLSEIDLEKIEHVSTRTEKDIERSEVDKLKKNIDDNLIPISEEMVEELEKVDVTNEEIKKIHKDYAESIQLKESFSKELGAGTDLFIAYEESTDQLIKDSEAVNAAKKERQSIIQKDHSKQATNEIDKVIDIVNEKSKELEDNVTLLQGDDDAIEKERIVEEVLMPILDGQIEKLNQLPLETDDAKSVRSMSLEMFYTFKSYYRERINIIKIYEEEQDVQTQKSISKIETFKKLDDTYHEELNKLKEETK